MWGIVIKSDPVSAGTENLNQIHPKNKFLLKNKNWPFLLVYRGLKDMVSQFPFKTVKTVSLFRLRINFVEPQRCCKSKMNIFSLSIR